MNHKSALDRKENPKGAAQTIALVPATDAHDFFVAGIGISSGGFEALEQFFANMPPIHNISFIVIQHLSSNSNSLASETLSKGTAMKVYRIQNRMQIMPGCIYLNPPGFSVTISKGKLYIQELQNRVNFTINTFLESLAADACERSIGIILSGTGSDGTRGCRAIKEAGGIVMAQDARTARFNGMPKSVISTSICDFILPVAQIPEQLLRYMGNFSSIDAIASEEHKNENNGYLSRIFNVINNRYSVDFSLYKQSTVLRCISRRIRICQMPTLALYYSYLNDNSDEVEHLYNSLLIGVTRFFRDIDAFDVIKNRVIPEIVGSKTDDAVVRVWVAGCSTGEEAYSLAILFKEYMDMTGQNLTVKIFATDIDRKAIEYASAGVYPDSVSDDVSQERLERYFIKKKDTYQVSKLIRGMVIFSIHDLISNPPFHKMDLLACRNLLIYFQPDLQKRIISIFQYALEANGFLFLGACETAGELNTYFSNFDVKWKIFKKKNVRKRPLVDNFSITSPSARIIEEKPIEDYLTRAARNNLEMEDLYASFMEQCLPPSVIVDENGVLVQVCGDVDKFLKIPRGKIRYTIQKMVPKELSTALGNAMNKVRKDKQTITYTDIKVKLSLEQVNINLIVKPLLTKKNGALIVIIFKEVRSSALKDHTENFDTISALQERIADLEQELEYTRENLQSSIEDIETSSEELQSTNEELVVSNEEMSSTNEELQSVNEELMIVNSQYQDKIQELADLNNDMTNFLNSTTIGTIFLDSNMRVRKFTPAVTKEVNLIEQDIGRPISHITHNLINEDLIKESRQEMGSLIPLEKEVQSTNGNWYLLKYSPFRTNEDVVKGVVLSLVDITARKEAEKEQQKSKERYEKLVALSPFAIIIINDGKILFTNPEGLKLFQIKDERNFLGKPINQYLDVNELQLTCKQNEYKNVDKQTVPPLKKRIIHEDGSALDVEVFSMPFTAEGNKSQLIILRDITSIEQEEKLRKENEDSKNQLNEAIALDSLKSDFFSNISHELRTPLSVIMSALQLLESRIKDREKNDENALQKKYFKIMRQNCYRQLRLVNNMIDITKIDSGFYDVKLKSNNIVKVVKDITLSVSDYIEDKGIQLIFQTDTEEMITAFDSDSIERIMLNLLSNAVKFTDAGGMITVKVSDKGDTVSISVKDNGIGIPSDKQSIIFDRFRQVDQSLTRNHEGSGIGLSLVKALVAMHNGTISVKSEYGKGAEFIVEIPVKRVSDEYVQIKKEIKRQNNIEKINIEFADIYDLQ